MNEQEILQTVKEMTGEEFKDLNSLMKAIQNPSQYGIKLLHFAWMIQVLLEEKK